MKKRLLIISAILAMLVLTLAACGKNTAQTANEPSEDEMVSSAQEQKEESQPEEAVLEESAPEESSSEEPLQQLGYEVSVAYEGTPITITADGQVFEAVLDGSETAAAFAEMLPMTLSMQRVGGDREFYGGMDSALPYDSTDAQTAFENGDIAFWLGGDGLCLLYNNQVENPEISAGIIVFGKITSDLSGFFDMDDHLDVVIEITR